MPRPRDDRMKAVTYDPTRDAHEEIPSRAISDALSGDRLLWLDVSNPRPEDARMLGDEFGLHPLALEEILTEHPRPKCTQLPGSYLLVMYAAGEAKQDRLEMREVVILLGNNFLITAHHDPFPEIDECLRRWRDNSAVQKTSIGAPLYSLLDTLVDGYFPIIDHVAERVEDIEEELLQGRGNDIGSGLFTLKKDLLVLRRLVSGQREALNELLRQDRELITGEWRVYFESVYDHLVRLVESIDTYRDLLASAMDLRLSVISNRMNQVMKTLTAISTILMTAGLVAGIYGMNFVNMPELHTRYGYYFALAAMAGLSGLLALYFRKIKWF